MDDFEDDEENMWEGRHDVGDVSVNSMSFLNFKICCDQFVTLIFYEQMRNI